MVKTTREQRKALFNKWYFTRHDASSMHSDQYWMTYREFRKTVVPTIGCDNAIAVPWCGMWLCIETDGYTHS